LTFSVLVGTWAPFNPETVRLMIGEFRHFYIMLFSLLGSWAPFNVETSRMMIGILLLFCYGDGSFKGGFPLIKSERNALVLR